MIYISNYSKIIAYFEWLVYNKVKQIMLLSYKTQ